MNLPAIGSIYAHKETGQVYRVDSVTNLATQRPADFPITVVYTNLATRERWSRPLEIFKERVLAIKGPLYNSLVKEQLELDLK